MADDTPIKLDNFGDIVSVALARCKGFSVRDRDVNLMKGFINEVYTEIMNQKAWPFRKMDRSFVMDLPESVGTVAVEDGSRIVDFSSLAIDKTYRGKTIVFENTQNMYRIIGVNSLEGKAYLDAAYVGQDNATATYQIYTYEFPIPPDCDNIEQIYVDTNYSFGYTNNGQLDGVPNNRFNRMLSGDTLRAGIPRAWCRDGKIKLSNVPPLDEMLLNYDFLSGDSEDKVDRLRIYPIQPDIKRVIHLSYTLRAKAMTSDEHKPLMDKNDWWVLVHGGAMEYLYHLDRQNEAVREEIKFNKLFKDMCTRYGVSEARPRMYVDTTRYRRVHSTRYSRRKELHYISRQAEYD